MSCSKKAEELNAYADGFADFLGEISTRSSDKPRNIDAHADGFADFLSEISTRSTDNLQDFNAYQEGFAGFLGEISTRSSDKPQDFNVYQEGFAGVLGEISTPYSEKPADVDAYQNALPSFLGEISDTQYILSKNEQAYPAYAGGFAGALAAHSSLKSTKHTAQPPQKRRKTARKLSIDNFFAETPHGFDTQKNKAEAPLKNRKQVAVCKPLHEGRENILHHIFAKCWEISEGVSQALRGDARKSTVFMGLMQKAQEVQTIICMVKYEQNRYVMGDVKFKGDYVIALDRKDNQEAGKKVKRCESMHCIILYRY